MKDLIEKIIKFIPEYLMNLGKLLARPKTFLEKSHPNTEQGFRSGLKFLAVSLVLFVIAVTPTMPNKLDIWKQLAAAAVGEFLAVAAAACVLRLAWRLVGGRASTRSLFTLYCYTSSVVVVLLAVISLIWDGILRVFDPAVHAAVWQAQLAHQSIPLEVATSKAYLAAFGVLMCGFLVLTVWFIASWGAFRAVNHTTRGRSVVAFILANVLCLPVVFVLYLIGQALSP